MMRYSRTAGGVALRRWWCDSLSGVSSAPGQHELHVLAAVPRGCGDSREYSAGNSFSLFSPSRHLVGFSRGFSSEVAAVASEAGGEAGSPEVERVYKELDESIRRKRIPEASLLPGLLRSCATPGDVKLAYDAVDRLRRLKAVQGQQKTNYSPHIAQLVAEACVRSGDAQAALPTLVKLNVYGFTPSLDQAHLLLRHALREKDTRLMMKVVRTMVASEVFPTPVSAELILRTCKDAGNTELLFQMARELRVNGITLKKPLYDMLIATAANVGDVKTVHEVQEWREAQGVDRTTASAFALAKALVLDGNSEEAAKVIVDHCRDDAEKRDIYLQIMVKVWPLQVGAKLGEEEKESFLEDLKKKVVTMTECLTQSGCSLPVDVDADFAKGAGGSKSKAEEEVWTASAAS